VTITRAFNKLQWWIAKRARETSDELGHREEAESFYRDLRAQRMWVGMEASGHARWFERLLGELQLELWIGDAAEIRTKRVRKQKTDRQDAQLLLRMLLEDRFPRIWVQSWENRDLRQLWRRMKGCVARRRNPQLAFSDV
jgi:transposase